MHYDCSQEPNSRYVQVTIVYPYVSTATVLFYFKISVEAIKLVKAGGENIWRCGFESYHCLCYELGVNVTYHTHVSSVDTY